MVLAAGLAGLGSCAPVGGPALEFRGRDAPPPTVTAYQVAERLIVAADADRHVRFLASDDRFGRGMGTDGLERAAAWLATEFRLAGLDPAGDRGGYLQYWPYQNGRVGAESEEAVLSEAAVLVPNVVARAGGVDTARAGEYVVLVAHYDHLGIGEPTEEGDSIYNGADDNASGVASLVQVARAVGAVSDQLSRPILFLAVSGSEDGQLGTRWFVEHPTVPLDDAVAVMDLDMVGGNQPDTIGVLGSDSLAAIIAGLTADTRLRLDVVRDPPGVEQVGPGDHAVFSGRGIPAVRFFAGLHDDYHTPSDEARGVDADKVARVARLVFLTVHSLAMPD